MPNIRGQFKLSENDDRPVFIEVERPRASNVTLVSSDGLTVAQGNMSFEDALDGVKPVVSKLFEKLQDMAKPTSEVEVKFGLKFTADAGAIFAKVGSEVNYEITLKWQNNQAQ
ncbi:MAG: CU044_2847 family protein [Crocosphaera sp.]|nr:CU044_2847 family protein [Crocosphaera sp.]